MTSRPTAASPPGRATGRATWDHIWHFWDPSMRNALLAAADADAGLTPTAAAAVRLLRTGGEPAPQSRATEFAMDAGGNTEGDAG